MNPTPAGFAVEELAEPHDCKVCAQPARFRITMAITCHEESFCGTCLVAFVLQMLKRMGVNLAGIESAFMKVSLALDRPVVSQLLQ